MEYSRFSVRTVHLTDSKGMRIQDCSNDSTVFKNVMNRFVGDWKGQCHVKFETVSERTDSKDKISNIFEGYWEQTITCTLYDQIFRNLRMDNDLSFFDRVWERT